MSKILLLGSNDRAALEFVRSLGKRGLEIDILRFGPPTICEYSRFCSKSYFFGNPEKDLTDFNKLLLKHLQFINYDLIVPINDLACEIIFQKEFNEFNSNKIMGPSSECYDFAHDKAKTLELCRRIGVPTPDSLLISSLSEVTEHKIDFPVYAKPQFSRLIKDGVTHNFQVRKISTDLQLANFLRDNILNCGVLLQKQISGWGIGVNVFAVSGSILAKTATERVHEPINGGSSSYRRSVRIDKKLAKYTELIISEAKWTGLAMIEFKTDGADYYVMEINGRPWGSIGVPIKSGIDFPYIAYCHFADIKDKPLMNYLPGKYGRNLYRDIHWFLIEIRSLKFINALKSIFKGFFRMISGKEYIDEFSLTDPRPFLFSIVLIFRRYFLSILKINKNNLNNVSSSKISLPIEQKSKVLFVCKGNINRSAFAENFFKSRLAHNILVDSAGTMLRRNRMASEEATEVALKFGVDLSQHKSKSVFDLNLDEYSHIFVFDNANYKFMADNFSFHLNRVFRLTRDNEIDDPHGLGLEVFHSIFSKIDSALCSLELNLKESKNKKGSSFE